MHWKLEKFWIIVIMDYNSWNHVCSTDEYYLGKDRWTSITDAFPAKYCWSKYCANGSVGFMVTASIEMAKR